MRVEGAHGEGIDGIKPEAIAFIDGYMYSRVPQLRDVLYSPTESEASRLDLEQKATLALTAINLGQFVRGVGNTLQGLVGLGGGGAILVKNGEDAALTGLASKVEDTVKALPGPRQIDAAWSVNDYKKGGVMTGIEHVMYRHGPNTGFSGVSKFAEGTSVKDISTYVDNALRYGKVIPNGPGGYVVEYNVGRLIGVDKAGSPSSTLKINVRDGVIHTVFPL